MFCHGRVEAVYRQDSEIESPDNLSKFSYGLLFADSLRIDFRNGSCVRANAKIKASSVDGCNACCFAGFMCVLFRWGDHLPVFQFLGVMAI